MKNFKQVKDRAPIAAKHEDLIVACPPMKSNDNVSMIARTASCLGAKQLIITGQNKVNPHISRDCDLQIKHHNSLLPVVKRCMAGWRIIGLEQSVDSSNLYSHQFLCAPTMLIVGNECRGMDQSILDCLDDVIEIPLFGTPHSLNVAVAASMCLFEYVRQSQVGG